jgi:hypothetical protein
VHNNTHTLCQLHKIYSHTPLARCVNYWGAAQIMRQALTNGRQSSNARAKKVAAEAAEALRVREVAAAAVAAAATVTAAAAAAAA